MKNSFYIVESHFQEVYKKELFKVNFFFLSFLFWFGVVKFFVFFFSFFSTINNWLESEKVKTNL